MTIKPAVMLLCAIVACFPSSFARAQFAIEDLDASYQFLVSYRSTHGGALYAPTEGSLKGIALPLSFYDSAQYWGAYVCVLPNVSCKVTDYYDPHDYSLKPRNAEQAAFLQAERVNVHNGTNIYDAATWQIAVMLGAAANKFGNPLDADAYGLAAGQNRVLGQDRYSPNVPLGRRATTSGNQFNYNGLQVTDPKEAYAFRMTASTWLADDPLRSSRYASLISTAGLPSNNPEYQVGRVTWSDWKPVTGDNAWAYFLGPLQAAYIHYIVEKKGNLIPFEDQGVQSALEILTTFAAMQSALGAVYYAPSGTLQSEADKPVNPHFASVENNFSLYAGLRVLQATLRAELSGNSSLETAATRRIDRALAIIHTMISGGRLPGGRTTLGMESFFRNCAWHDGEFVQGGLANDPASPRAWIPVLDPKAVDVNTWGIAALGADQVDRWFGFGSAHRVWKGLKSWGAYGVDHTLWGVGYTDTDGNGQDGDRKYRQGILSAEWTAGAITMVRNMIKHYHSVRESSANYAGSRQYEEELQADERAMLQGIQALRLDRYAAAAFPGKPNDYSSLIVGPTKPYLYASRRYRIPFGWYANPLPSTSSTAWVIMIADKYDPFGYGGKPN
jgi:hypothetical protein